MILSIPEGGFTKEEHAIFFGETKGKSLFGPFLSRKAAVMRREYVSNVAGYLVSQEEADLFVAGMENYYREQEQRENHGEFPSQGFENSNLK